MMNVAHDGNGHTEPIVTDPLVRDDVINDMTRFVIQGTRKYLSGQLEHGGTISDRDLDNEIDQEITDLFFYHSANKRKQQHK